MVSSFDLSQRPASYFRPVGLENYLIGKVKGAVVRQHMQRLLDAGRHDELRRVLTAEGISEVDRKGLEAIHPMFMGGNYLPDTARGEVVIGSIAIRSTLSDVTSAYARMGRGYIHYRVVDEYGGDTLNARRTARRKKPMTLGEFTDFFLTAWPLLDVLAMNYDGDLERKLAFFTAQSDFYPDFDAVCREKVLARFACSG